MGPTPVTVSSPPSTQGSLAINGRHEVFRRKPTAAFAPRASGSQLKTTQKTSRDGTVISILTKAGHIRPSNIKVYWTEAAPLEAEPLVGAHSPRVVHDLALSMLLRDDDY